MLHCPPFFGVDLWVVHEHTTWNCPSQMAFTKCSPYTKGGWGGRREGGGGGGREPGGWERTMTITL